MTALAMNSGIIFTLVDVNKDGNVTYRFYGQFLRQQNHTE